MSLYVLHKLVMHQGQYALQVEFEIGVEQQHAALVTTELDPAPLFGQYAIGQELI